MAWREGTASNMRLAASLRFFSSEWCLALFGKLSVRRWSRALRAEVKEWIRGCGEVEVQVTDQMGWSGLVDLDNPVLTGEFY